MALREHISPTTLERVWGYSTRHYDTVSRCTLDVLARYAVERENGLTLLEIL